MRRAFVISVFAVVVALAIAANDYLWGEVDPGDYLIAKDTVSKGFIIGLSVSQKYVYKQKNNLSTYTITAIKVSDKKQKNGATVVLIQGGPGFTSCTVKFQSQRGFGIKDIIEIYGR